jgi:hypothetical protein
MQGWDDYNINESGEPEEDGFMDDMSDDERDEIVPMEATFDQQVHSTEQNDCGPLIVKEAGKEDEYRKAMSQLDPIDRLKQLIGSVVYNLGDKVSNIMDISSTERNIICRSVDDLTVVNIEAKYINPLAYVLGYVAYHRGFMINDSDSMKKKKDKSEKINNEIFSELDNINTVTSNYSVFAPDVIRYMKLWDRITV